jgi:hypothetical protein
LRPVAAATIYHRLLPLNMAFHVNAGYPPPKTWQQFEELCADTYAADWADPTLQRYGRAGQSQHGIDIVARHGSRSPVGLQCRKKSRWPVASLTTREVDDAVKDALKFKPKLRSFYILTTVPDDARLREAHGIKKEACVLRVAREARFGGFVSASLAPMATESSTPS